MTLNHATRFFSFPLLIIDHLILIFKEPPNTTTTTKTHTNRQIFELVHPILLPYRSIELSLVEMCPVDMATVAFHCIACNLSSFSVNLHLNHFALHIKMRVVFRIRVDISVFV